MEKKMLEIAIKYLAGGKTCPKGEIMNHCDYDSCSECWRDHLKKEAEEGEKNV